MTAEILDVRHTLCPIPVIRTQAAAGQLDDGTRLKILCTDPGALIDIPVWGRIHGHRVVSTRREGNEIEIELEIRKP